MRKICIELWSSAECWSKMQPIRLEIRNNQTKRNEKHTHTHGQRTYIRQVGWMELSAIQRVMCVMLWCRFDDLDFFSFRKTWTWSDLWFLRVCVCECESFFFYIFLNFSFFAAFSSVFSLNFVYLYKFAFDFSFFLSSACGKVWTAYNV